MIFVAYELNLPLNMEKLHYHSQSTGEWRLIWAHDSRPKYRSLTYIAVPLLGPHQPRYIGITLYMVYTVETPYNTNVGVQQIPDRAIWKPVVAKRNNTNPWSCSEPQILVTRDSLRVHMAEQPASRDRLE